MAVYFFLMSKQLPIIVGAVIIIIIAIVAVVVFSQSKKSSQPSGETAVTQQAEGESAETTSKGSIKSLIGLGKNVTCTMTYPSGDGTTKGTVYVAGDKRIRGDFITNTQDKEMDSHMIQDGSWSYIWSSASPQGTKMKIEENVPTPTPGPQNQNVDVNTEVDYKCSDWSVDNSKFVPPSNIQFMEIGQITNQIPSQTNTTNQSQKAICDQITDPQAKAACIEATSGN